MHKINTKDDFNEFSLKFQQEHDMPYAFGIGYTFVNAKDESLATRWHAVNVKENFGTASVLMEVLKIDLVDSVTVHESVPIPLVEEMLSCFRCFENDGQIHQNINALKQVMTNCTIIFFKDEKSLKEEPVSGKHDGMFRLSLLSRLKFKPNELCLDNLFNVLPNLAWTDDSVYDIAEYNNELWGNDVLISIDDTYTRMSKDIIIDKIPLLIWGAPIPEGVRIANTKMVRLGAYLSPGTTVMHYGFVNFNAGTLGKAMVEGNISAGTTIGDGTDIGAGAGFLGTLSGGNSIKLSTGKDCLIGARAECGVILGDNCVVATGISFSQNTPIMEIKENGEEILGKVKDYNGKNNLTYRRHSITGRLEVIHKGNKDFLNEDLH